MPNPKNQLPPTEVGYTKASVKRGLIQICALLAVLLTPAVAQAQLTFITNNGAITITGNTGNPIVVNIPATTNS